MGVYFSTAVAYGIRLPYDPDNEEHLYPRNIPEGYDSWFGGDMMEGENVSVVVGPKDSFQQLMHSERHDQTLFGVFSLDEMYKPKPETRSELVLYALRHKLCKSVEANKQIGMWLLSSVD